MKQRGDIIGYEIKEDRGYVVRMGKTSHVSKQFQEERHKLFVVKTLGGKTDDQRTNDLKEFTHWDGEKEVREPYILTLF
jgi:hypothetical protein